MNRLAIFCAVAVLGVGLVLSAAPGTVAATADPHAPADSSQVKTWQDDGSQEHDASQVLLTEKQKKRLAKVYQRLFKAHVELLDLYAEYGLISEEQKERKLQWLKKRQEQIEANGYRPCTGKHPKKPYHRHTEPEPHAEP